MESVDTVEHRAIRGFLSFLGERLRDCQQSIDQHVAAIEAERPFRDQRVREGPTLYESIDLPRVRKLRDARGRASALGKSLRVAETLPFLRSGPPLFTVRRTPVFENVPPYRRLRETMLNYLQSSAIILDDGSEDRIKSTSRMYEHWTFMQIAAALRASGLRCGSLAGLIRRSTRLRYTLDIDRGTRVTFGTPDGRSISLRYEPLIRSEAAAREQRDTVFRGSMGQAAWSPDMLIEVLSPQDSVGLPPEVEYAIVIDAKYTRQIHDHHWERTTKYLQIRSTRTGRQVAKQLWLIHPSAEPDIVCRDPAVRWTKSGPDRPMDEMIEGIVGMVPGDRDVGAMEDVKGVCAPTEIACEFVTGILAYLGVEPPPVSLTGVGKGR